MTDMSRRFFRCFWRTAVSMRKKLQLKTFSVHRRLLLNVRGRNKKQRGDCRRSRSTWRAGLEAGRQASSGQPSTVAGTGFL